MSRSSLACSRGRLSTILRRVSRTSISPSVKVWFWSVKSGVQAEMSRGSPPSMTARLVSLTSSRKAWKSTAAAGAGVGVGAASAVGVGAGAGAHPASRARDRARGRSFLFISRRFLSIHPDQFPLF